MNKKSDTEHVDGDASLLIGPEYFCRQNPVEFAHTILLIFAFQNSTMAHHTFKLAAGTEYIPLDKLLKLVRAVGSGGEAHAVIQEGMVEVNGTTELQKRKKIRTGDRVEFNGARIIVE